MSDEGDRHKLPNYTVRMDRDDWKEFGEVVARKGEGRSEVVARMVRAFLKRPGVTIPRLKDYEPPD